MNCRQPNMEMDTKTYEDLARAMLGMHNIAKDEDKVFRSFFGAPIRHIVLLWNKIVSKDSLPKGAEPHHLLWALVFLKNYSTTPVLQRICGWPSRETFQKWSWYFIDWVAKLNNDVIKLDK